MAEKEHENILERIESIKNKLLYTYDKKDSTYIWLTSVSNILEYHIKIARERGIQLDALSIILFVCMDIQMQLDDLNTKVFNLGSIFVSESENKNDNKN